MAFDEALAKRVRQVLARRKTVKEKKMFGGVAFFLSGNMMVCVSKDSLIVRLGQDQSDEAVMEPQVQPFEMSGRPMKGWVRVAQEGVQKDEQLSHVIQRAIKFVRTLAAK